MSGSHPDSATTDAILSLEARIDSLLPRDMQTLKSDALVRLVDDYAALSIDAGTALGAIAPTATEIERGVSLLEHPIFVCGVPRSGTTLLQGLFNSSEEILVLPSEGSYLTSLEPRIRALDEESAVHELTREWIGRLIDVNGGGRHWLLGRSDPGALPYVRFARLLRGWAAALAANQHIDRIFRPHLATLLAFRSTSGRGNGERYWLDKTPGNEFHAGRLRSVFPKARFVHVVRDPRAVVASRLRLQRQVGLGDRNLHQVLRQLRRSMEIALRQSSHGTIDRYVVVRYEDLVESPQSAMQGIVDALQLNLASTTFAPVLHDGHRVANSSFSIDALERETVYRSSLQRHESYLSAAERRAVSASVERIARGLGYRMQAVPAAIRWLHAAASLSHAAIGRARKILFG